jgi:hypothetical protein
MTWDVTKPVRMEGTHFMNMDGGCHCGYIRYEATIGSEHIRDGE